MPKDTNLETPHTWKLSVTEFGHLKSEFIWAHDSVMPDPIRSKRYQAPGQSAFLIRKGRLKVETSAGRTSVGPGFWCLPHQGPRVLKMDPGGHILTVRFRVFWPGGDPLFNSPVAEVFEAAKVPRLERAARALVRAVNRAVPGAKADLPWRQTDLLSYIKLQQTFDEWVYAYVETMLEIGAVPSRLAKTDPRVLKLMSWLDDLSLSHKLTEQEMLTVCGLSSSQLNRLFARDFLQTPHQYFENRKLTRAKMLIRSSSMAMKEMAFELGFGSIQAFSRWFRKKSGQSPREFQNDEQV